MSGPHHCFYMLLCTNSGLCQKPRHCLQDPAHYIHGIRLPIYPYMLGCLMKHSLETISKACSSLMKHSSETISKDCLLLARRLWHNEL